MKAFNKEQVLALLKKHKAGRTNRDYAAMIGVHESYLSDVLKGRRDPGPRILAALGLQPAYAPLEECAQ